MQGAPTPRFLFHRTAGILFLRAQPYGGTLHGFLFLALRVGKQLRLEVFASVSVS